MLHSVLFGDFMRYSLLVIALVGCADQSINASLDEITVAILSHRDGDTVSAGVAVTFRGVAGATESRPAAINVAWFANDEAVCLDTPDSDSLVQCTTALGAGEVTLRLEARTPGDEASTSIDLFVEAGVSPPEVAITEPSAQSTFLEGELILFEGTATDAETLATELSVAWTSSLDGTLSLGLPDSSGRISGATNLSLGQHLITLIAVDGDDNSGTDSVIVNVTEDGVDPDTSDPDTSDLDTSDPDTEDPDVDTDDSDSDTTPSGGFDYGENCGGIGVYERVLPMSTTGNFNRIVYSPDGTYALILEDYDTLWKFEDATSTLTQIATTTDEDWLSIRFDPAGFAWVGGGTDADNPNPRLYRYVDGEGLTAITIPGLTDGGMVSTTRIIAMDQRWDGVWAVLADNHAPVNGVVYMNELMIGDTGDGDWEYGGAIAHGSSYVWSPVSISWGMNLGEPVALTANRQIQTLMYDANLPNGRWSMSSRGGLGNHGQMVFDPLDHQVAWMINGSGNVYAWQGLMMGSGNQHDFGNNTFNYPRRFTTSPDGEWKIFVGGRGMVAFSDSPWSPIDSSRFALAPIANWGEPPWSAQGSQGFSDVAWRPGTCSGLIAGDATQNRSMLVRWFMQ
jgi:hypothetical protein